MAFDGALPEYTAVTSAIVGVVSAILALLSYRLSIRQHAKTSRDGGIRRCKEILDSCYLESAGFVSAFFKAEETSEKRMARDKVIYYLEMLRHEYLTIHSNGHEAMWLLDNVSMRISDITYEHNLDKITRDLAGVREKITRLKGNLI